MTTYWRGVKRLSRLCKQKRRHAADQLMPALKEICKRAEIEIKATEHGWQFRKDEYVINWHPTSNKVRIQYRLKGHNQTVAFLKDGQDDKPRIVLALEELIEIGRPVHANI